MLKVPTGCSWVWRHSLNIELTFGSLLSFSIGHDKDVYLWWHSLHPHGPLLWRYGMRTIQKSGLSLDARVSEVIQGSDRCWPAARAEELVGICALCGVMYPLLVTLM
ncbi:hypothetical protein OIU76_004124 [Salix suchowensis]|nr:hypothetical protein OIU76_004124 [Salix suchowensis]